MFVVIILIGTGWSSLKPFLNPREKNIFLIVLPLQVFDNIAYIVLGEMAPASAGFATWTSLIHIVDLLCCILILMPIYWSVHHLRQAVEADGKGKSHCCCSVWMVAVQLLIDGCAEDEPYGALGAACDSWCTVLLMPVRQHKKP